MDKLKAIEYFACAAREGSFARAAQRMEVSVPAIIKQVGALERSLGTELLERGARGVRLTPHGNEYLDRCRAVLSELEQLRHAERALGAAAERVSGLLVVAGHPQLLHHVLLPALPHFHDLHPDVEIDLRTVNRIGDADAAGADVLLLHGWPEVPPDYVHRNLGGDRMLIMAAPGHWAALGVPRQPDELARHPCLSMRNPAGIVLDLWEFRRGDDAVQVPVKGWLSSNAREAVLDLVIGGHGVGRFAEMTTRGHVASGRLVPVLLDWEVQGGPPMNLLYRGSARGTPRVRVFVDYLMQCLRDLSPPGQPLQVHAAVDRPAWHVRGIGRASSALRLGPSATR